MQLFPRFKADLATPKGLTPADQLRRVRDALIAAGEGDAPLTFWCDDCHGLKTSAVTAILAARPHLEPFRARHPPQLSPHLAVLSNIPRGWLWGPQRPAPIPADAPRVTWDDLIAMADGIPRKHPIDDLRVWVDARALTDLSTEARIPCERNAAIGLAPHTPRCASGRAAS